MANSAASKNLAMRLATKTYTGLRSIGTSVRSIFGNKKAVASTTPSAPAQFKNRMSDMKNQIDML